MLATIEKDGKIIKTTERYTIYSPENDITFIMEKIYDREQKQITLECIGWYFGEPADLANDMFSDRNMKAILIEWGEVSK